MKYANGRFFLNAELGGFINQTNRDYNQGAQALFPFPAITPNPTYIEHIRYVIEAGVLAGPLKFSVIYGNVPGGDNGTDNNAFNGSDKSYQAGLVNNTLFDMRL